MPFEIVIFMLILFFIFRAFSNQAKKVKEAQKSILQDKVNKSKSPMSSSNTTSSTSTKPTSLEELLKEFAKQSGQTNTPVEEKKKPTPFYVNYDEEYEKSGSSEIIDYEDPTMNFKGISKEDLSREEHLQPYLLKKKTYTQFNKLLHNKKSIKTAFILSEVLRRKY